MTAATRASFWTALILAGLLRAAGGESRILPANPGLDGGQGGHWGKQAEGDWRDSRWQQMDTGPFLASILPAPNGPVLKGLSIRLGEDGGAAVCFDTGLLTLRAGWTGDFLKVDPARYGLIMPPKIVGAVQFLAPNGPAWGDGTREYRGFYLNGRRLTLSYAINGVAITDSPWVIAKDGMTLFTRELEIAPATQSMSLNLVSGSGAVTEDSGIVIVGTNAQVTCVGLAPGGNAKLIVSDDVVRLMIPSRGEKASLKLLTWSGPSNQVTAFAQALKTFSPAASEKRPLWGGWIKMQGQVATQPGAYVIDTVTVPYTNPYKALMFLSGVDFFENGDAAVCSLHGDVWLVRGIDENLKEVAWKRFATGLFQPLGLKIVNNRVHVLGRDQITILHDQNGDWEADYYENLHNGIETSKDGHDYVTSLENDREGNFYYADPRGVHRVAASGKTSQVVATGFRNPNGMSVGPQGEITVAPQEGEWTPASMICEVRPGGHYGYGGPRVTPERPVGYDAPLCYVPRWIDNSTGSQVWANSDRWGPLEGQMLSLSFGRSSIMLVLREVIDGVPQGAVVPLPGRFLSGVMRGTFRKQDGQLYVVGARGWVSNAIREGCFQRVRFAGRKSYLPLKWHAHRNGIRLTFSEQLARETVEDTGSYGIEQWNYKYAKEYGSKEYSVLSPDAVGHDMVSVSAATLLKDGKTVFLQIPNFSPVMQMAIKYNLKAVDGQNVRGEVFATVNKLGAAFAEGLAKNSVE